jgi:hypothetical protein
MGVKVEFLSDQILEDGLCSSFIDPPKLGAP